MRKTGLALFIACFTIALFCVSAQALRLPDSGQTYCYEADSAVITGCGGTGQDGDYEINPMSYTDHQQSGTVTDNVTGLMWQKCGAGQDELSCAGDPQLYNWYEASGTTDGAYNPDSISVCGGLNAENFGGYNDWRLPSVTELVTLIDYSVAFPNATINPVFLNSKTYSYWTSDSYSSSRAWVVRLAVNSVDNSIGIKTSRGLPVRCVRGRQDTERNYTDHGNGTITDGGTGLMWQKCRAGKNNDSGCTEKEAGIKSWSEALAYCNDLSLGEHDDWRLPNIQELESLIDFHMYPAIDPIFTNADDNTYWSSTTYSTAPERAWNVQFATGKNTYEYKPGGYIYARCVRGQSRSFVVEVKATGDGMGSVSSNHDGISYTYNAEPATGMESFTAGSNITVTATAQTGSTVSWNGTCAAAGGVEENVSSVNIKCSFNYLSAAKTITASFDLACAGKPVKLGNAEPAYDYIQDAYNVASSQQTIRARGKTFGEALDFNAGKSIAVIGGYDCSFQTNNSFSAVGSLRIGANDAVTIDKIIIK